MNALDQLQDIKSWLAQTNEESIDAFATQHTTLVRLFAENLITFRRGIENMNIIIPKETTVIDTTMIEKTLTEKTITPISLENAKQDEPYRYQVLTSAKIANVTFSQACGLTWCADQQTLEGTPHLSGELEVCFTLENGLQEQAKLWINPNPKKLWNNIPSNPNERFWKPDSASGQISTPFGKLLAARMRGRSHAHKGTCCDDDFSIAFHEKSGVHFIAVADGAGSAEFSRLGSKLAVETARDKVLEQLSQNEKYQSIASFYDIEKLKGVANGLLFQAVQAAFQAQETQAEQAQIPLKSLSCTLLVALSLPLADHRWFTACYWVGDGAVAILDLGLSQVTLLGEVDSGSYSGETQFLTREEVEPEKLISRIHTVIQDYPPLLMLMTDGVSDPKFQTDAKLQTFDVWQTFWAELAAPLQANDPTVALAHWLDFWSKGEHDDRTLAMFIPQAEWGALSKNVQNLPTSEVNSPELVQEIQEESTLENQENVVVAEEMAEVESVPNIVVEDVVEMEERTINITQNNKVTTVVLTKASDLVKNTRE